MMNMLNMRTEYFEGAIAANSWLFQMASKALRLDWLLAGLKAPNMTAWAVASTASAGPGKEPQRISQGLKGRNIIRRLHCAAPTVLEFLKDFIPGATRRTLHPRLSYCGLSALAAARIRAGTFQREGIVAVRSARRDARRCIKRLMQ
jgi:hypothetical protein